MNVTEISTYNSNSNYLIKTILTILILLSYNITWFVSSNVITVISFFIVLLCSIVLVFLYKITLKSLIIIFAIQLLILFSWVINNITGNNANIGIHLNIFVCILLSYTIIARDHENIILKTFYRFYFIYLILLLILLLSGKSPATVYQGSRNLISQLFVVYGGLFFIYKPFRKNLKFKMLFYILIVAVSVLAIGRSGIITSLILFAAVFINNYKLKFNRKSLVSLCFITVILLTCFFYIDNILYFLSNYPKLEYLQDKGTSDSHRSYMIREFLYNYDLGVFFFGINLEELPIISSYNDNPHNSFIYLNAKLGLVAILMFIIILSFLLKLLIKFEFATALAVLAVLLRLSTDSLGALITLPVIFLCVYSFYYNQTKHITN